MAYRLSFSPQALFDIGAAHTWYEQCSPGLGAEFLAAIELQLTRLQQAPMLYAEVMEGVRRSLLPRFPYGLFFACRDDRVHVLAVLHHARDPRHWPHRS